jgi:hypothetical protein
MTIPMAVAGVLAVFLLAAVMFMRVDAAALARGLKSIGPAVLGLAGLALLLVGRVGLGGMLISGALAWYSAGRARERVKKTPGKRSSVRTAALEMELDHDTGGLEGVVLAGGFEGRMLSRMNEKELVQLYRELYSDSESRQLLETYLDGRFPLWREGAKADGDDRERVAPGSGAMTKQEAYKVLGLEAGATAADIRKAHRRLMQRLHPDIGGTSFLAARINEAKDILLSDHN